jgi:hypothetical protein
MKCAKRLKDWVDRCEDAAGVNVYRKSVIAVNSTAQNLSHPAPCIL